MYGNHIYSSHLHGHTPHGDQAVRDSAMRSAPSRPDVRESCTAIFAMVCLPEKDLSPRPPQDRPKTTQRPRQDRPLKKYRFFIKIVDFSLEKCRFGANRGVLHYGLRRKRVILRTNDTFELEICVKASGGRTALMLLRLLLLS